MNAFLSLARWLFAIPLIILGLIHFMDAQQLAAMVPNYLPVRMAWSFAAGTGLIAAGVSILLGKYDKLATVLLAALLVLFALLIHVASLLEGGEKNQFALFNLMQDLALAGGALLYAQYVAKDRSVLG
jgi:uncharacterized membrane protein